MLEKKHRPFREFQSPHPQHPLPYRRVIAGILRSSALSIQGTDANFSQLDGKVWLLACGLYLRTMGLHGSGMNKKNEPVN